MTHNSFPVMLFAAGFGTRMKDLTKDRPKPLIQVAGRPLIDYALALAEAVNPPKLVANLHYKPEMLNNYLSPRGVLVSNEQPDILETGGGLRKALPLLGGHTVFTMNTDVIWNGPNPLGLLLDAWDPDLMDALLMCVPVANATGYQGDGDFTADTDGRIQRGPGLIYGGVQIIKTSGLDEIEDRSFSLNLLWNRMQADHRLFAVSYPGRWCDVGHPAGISLAEEVLTDV